jgi:chemotaxis signal transduction protein
VLRPERGSVVVWRLGEALLAVDLDAVDEVVGVEAGGRARARTGLLELVAPPGLTLPTASRQAVVVRGGGGDRAPSRLALAADQVEGVYGADQATTVARPAWLASLDAPHVAGLVQLDDGRLAAALDVGALFGGP